MIMTLLVVRRKNSISLDYDDGDEMITTRRSSIRPRQPQSRPKDIVRVKRQPTKRPQPTRAPKRVEKPELDSPPVRQVKRVKRAPGTVTQTGEAPDDEEWDYADHGAYWDTDDPDSVDPYGEVEEYHKSEINMMDIANQVSEEMPVQEQTNEIDDEDIVDEISNSDVDDEINAALSKLTGKNVSINEEIDNQKPDDEKPATKKKGRRKVKRRKK